MHKEPKSEEIWEFRETVWEYDPQRSVVLVKSSRGQTQGQVGALKLITNTLIWNMRHICMIHFYSCNGEAD